MPVRGLNAAGAPDSPRTLIVGAHFSEDSGVGTFLGRLFCDWPPDRLATVCDSPLPPDWRRCRRHYRAGSLEFRLPAPLSWLAPARPSGPLAPPAPGAAPAASPTGGGPRGLAAGRRFRRGLRRLVGVGDLLYRVGPTPQLLRWARDARPEVLYGHCSTLDTLRFLSGVHRALGLPLVLHFMDDFPEALYRTGWASAFVRRRYQAEFEALVRSAAACIAICREMAEEYQKRYRQPVGWLPMPVELEAYRRVCRSAWSASRPLCIRYGGRVGWAIRQSLADVAAAVETLRQQGHDVTFEIATFQPEEVPESCRRASGVTVRAPGPLAAVPRLQADADVLLVCYDFDPVSFRQARYSMPSKLGDCLASGTPILVYAPAGLPVVEYARGEGWGEVVDRRDREALCAALRGLVTSPALREQRGRTARRLAFERHDAAVVSARLKQVLREAAGRRRHADQACAGAGGGGP